jgi:two-component system sensor histidine kinase/response regulator
MEENRKSKVLVVDDIQSNIEFVTEVLELENLEILSAKNGQRALQLCKESSPDLILLDISMPGIDGYEVCRILKEDIQTREIPIIFLTARVQKDDIIRGFEFGAVDYIIKPFNFNELISRVKTHLELKNKSEQLKNLNQKQESIIEERTLELKKAYNDLKLANENLLTANEKLSKLDKAKTEFVLHINHELRTPLNGIQGYVDLLAESISNEPDNSYVQSIQTLTNRLIKVAELSLLFTELKTRENQIEVQEVDLVRILNDAINCREISLKNIQIEIENPFNEIIVQAEPKLLHNCLSIIIDNAIKYSPINGIIEIGLKRAGQKIEFTLSDKGPGLSEKALEQLFSFFSADNLSHNSHGFGIGLATAKIILSLFGGEISIANRQPHGAIVKICLEAKF